MGLLNEFFKSPESVAKDLELKDEEFLKIWQDYYKTVGEKEEVINALSVDNYKEFLPKLQELLALELSDIEAEEKTEEELVGDLELIEQDKKIRQVEKIYECLAYAETKYKYIHKLLETIHNVLTTQLHIIDKLFSTNDVSGLISHLKSQLAVEQEVLKQIESRETFHDLFLNLIKGEHNLSQMDVKEKQLLKRMDVIMKSVFGMERKKGSRYQWAIRVFDGLQDQIKEYIARHEEDEVGSNPFIDFEYVNHSEFVDFVKQCAAELGQNPSERMVNVFVYVFREWFNQRE